MISLPKWLRARPRKLPSAPDPLQPPVDIAARSHSVATNINKPVVDIYRPHIQSGDCLIATGYQDFLSSLSILLTELPELQEPGAVNTIRVRIAFGVDTGNSKRIGRSIPISEEMRLSWLERSGLMVEDHSDLMAALARDAVAAGKIQLRVFDPSAAQELYGISGGRRMHAKIVSSPLGAVSGSANFSRSGLYQNIEYADGLDAGSHELEEERQKAAEQIWEASVDWTKEALEILDNLIRPVSAELAIARTVVEQKGFKPWLSGDRTEITSHALYDYQEELVYEASSIVYEHGIAFVEAPTGSGKTEIGCHLGEVLTDTFRDVVPPSPVHNVARKNAAVIAPPRVVPSWAKSKTNALSVIKNSDLSKKNLRGIGKNGLEDLRLDQFGVLIIDESHTVTPGFEQASQRAAAIELAPPSWNVCLSATLLGNRDVDWLSHMQEKRASIFMTPDYIQQMGDLFDREAKRSDDEFTLIDEMAPIDGPETALSHTARQELSNMLAPFLTRRQRHCVGEGEQTGRQTYPNLQCHGRPKNMETTPVQTERLEEIAQLCRELAPGSTITAVERSRFGTTSTRRNTQDQLYIRNLLNILRANSAQAAWEMEKGVIGKWLRDFEAKNLTRKKKSMPGQLELFESLAIEAAPTPKCDALTKLLASRPLSDIDRKRYRACAEIQQRKDRVVFLAERTDTLEIFAEELSKHGHHTNYVVGNRQQGQVTALTDLYGDDAGSFQRITQGRSVETYFRPGGRKAPKGPASVFMTYKMAEGINLQSGDTLVLLGLTSNLKELIQGLGRIDRIDSQFEKVNYHLVDIPVGHFASDDKISQRIANYKALSGEELAEVIDRLEIEDTEAILESVISYLRAPRVLRSNNFHDVLTHLSAQVSPKVLSDVSKAKIQGTWGAELALVSGRDAFTMLHLKGSHSRGSYFPPRLLMIRQDGTEGAEIIRDQITCARQLEEAFERTKSLGLADVSPSQEIVTKALAALASHVDNLTEWDLRPSRLESLLKALAAFLWRHNAELSINSDIEMSDQALFGHLSLQALEMICESWGRLIDPFWEQVKHEVRTSFAFDGIPQGYIALEQVLQKLEADYLNRGAILEQMREVLIEADRLSIRHEPEIASRIAVAFFSEGAGEH
jgi:Type III restriction enzyme, res subunit